VEDVAHRLLLSVGVLGAVVVLNLSMPMTRASDASTAIRGERRERSIGALATTTKFIVCSRCGAMPSSWSRSDARRQGLVAR